MIDVDRIIENQFPDLKHKSRLLQMATSSVLKKLLHQNDINEFIATNQHLVGLEFLDAVLENLNFSFRVSNRDHRNIPDQGRLLIVANHPVGSLDGLALIKLVSEIRPDVNIVATTMLSQIQPLKDLFIPANNTSSKSGHFNGLRKLLAALQKEQVVIMFPTGEVSRIRPQGVRDGKWKSGFIRLARRTQTPVLPVYVQARNSVLFYSLSTLYKPLGTLMLVNEMFNKQDQEISFHIGKLIPPKVFMPRSVSDKKLAKKMKKQVYSLARKKPKYRFPVIENVVHPVNRALIRKELRSAECIGQTQDGKHIYLFGYRSNSSVMREIGRLRELSFRRVQEGTGKPLDLDEYDRYYRHLILWDEQDLEIVGAYRIGECAQILKERGVQGLYCHSLFAFEEGMLPYMQSAIELGRSFVQPRYWGKRSLYYLWYGIGAYLARHPEIKHMFGPVSISASYPEAAQQKIIAFYMRIFGRRSQLIHPRMPVTGSAAADDSADHGIASEDDYRQAFRQLKAQLDELGVKVPVLFKQYVELCHPGGCEFLGFNRDPLFSNCIDAMILVHIKDIHQEKRRRYIDSHVSGQQHVA